MLYLTRWAAGLARRYLAPTIPQRWEHVQGTGRQAERIGPLLLSQAEQEMLIAAALLHDIGYSRALARSGFHPLDGAVFLTKSGAPAQLCNLVANHSAAAVTARLRGFADELAVFPDEPSTLRDALWYCDLTTDPCGKQVTFDERIADIRVRHGAGSINVRALDCGGLDARMAAVQRTTDRLLAAREA
jgi:hypothetical protein